MARPYFCVSPGFPTHRKTLRLFAEIGEAAYFVPPFIWAYASLNQQDGDFSAYTIADFSHILKLPEARTKKFIDGMKAAGFFDLKTEEGAPCLKLHDWDEWNAFHKLKSESASKAAQVRWAREKDKRDREQGRGAPPPGDGSPDGASAAPPGNKKAPELRKKILPRQGSNRNEVNGADRDGSGSPDERKRENRALQPALKAVSPTVQRHNLTAKLKALDEEIEVHIGRPGSTFRFRGEAAKAAAQEDFKALKQARTDTNRQLASLPL